MERNSLIKCKLFRHTNIKETQKPSCFAKIYYGLLAKNVEAYTIKQIADEILQGASILPCISYSEIDGIIYDYKETKNKDSENDDKIIDDDIIQDIIILDFDNKHGPTLSYEKFKERAKQHNIPIAFAHKSFGCSADLEKYHVFIVLDKTITTLEERCYLYDVLSAIFPERDGNCINSGRYFFGGLESIELNESAELNVENFLKNHQELLKDYRENNLHAKNQRSKDGKNENCESSSEAIDTKMITAIKTLNVSLAQEFLMEAFNTDHVDTKILDTLCNNYIADSTLNENEQLLQRMLRINLNIFLGIPYKVFRCIFDDHEDIHPSANIYYTCNGMYFYKCFANEEHILEIPPHLKINKLIACLSSTNKKRAFDFLCDVFNISKDFSQPPQVQKQKSINYSNVAKPILQKWQRYFYSEKKNKDSSLNKLLNKDIDNVLEIINYFIQNRAYEGYYLTSLNSLLSVTDIKKTSQMSNLLAILSILGIIKKNTIDVLNVSIKDSYNERMISDYKKMELYNDPTVLKFNPPTDKLFINIEKTASLLHKCHFRRQYICSDIIYAFFDSNIARQVYPQTYFSYSSIQKIQNDKQLLIDCIDKYGYLNIDIIKKANKSATFYYRYLPLILRCDDYCFDDKSKKVVKVQRQAS